MKEIGIRANNKKKKKRTQRGRGRKARGGRMMHCQERKDRARGQQNQEDESWMICPVSLSREEGRRLCLVSGTVSTHSRKLILFCTSCFPLIIGENGRTVSKRWESTLQKRKKTNKYCGRNAGGDQSSSSTGASWQLLGGLRLNGRTLRHVYLRATSDNLIEPANTFLLLRDN